MRPRASAGCRGAAGVALCLSTERRRRGGRAGASAQPHGLRRHGPQAGRPFGARRDRGAAGVHRAAPRLRQPRGSPARGHLQHHAAGGRRAQPVRDEAGGTPGRRARSSRSSARGRPTRTSSTSGRTRRCSSRRAGNQFSARVFPIPARGRKELIVSYSQEIPGGPALRAAAARAAAGWGGLALSVALSGQAQPVEQVEQADVTPSADFELDPRFLRGGAGLRSGDLVLARVRPIPAAEADPFTLDPGARRHQRLARARASRSRSGWWGDWRGASRRRRGRRRRWRWGRSIRRRRRSSRARRGPFGEGDPKRLRERQAFGASSLEGALGWAEARAKGRPYKRVIVVGDGVATAGETAGGRARGQGSRVKAAGVERSTPWRVGGLRDEATLKRLVTAGLARDGVVADGGLDPAVLERKLTLATQFGIPVTIEGARWQWPSVLDGVQAGDEVLVYAEVPAGPAGARLRGRRDGAGARSPPEASRPLLERSWAKAKITALVGRLGDEARKGDASSEGLVREVIDVSRRYRVVSPYTSLLVLETEADFARFGLDRKALADILTVDRRPDRGGGARGAGVRAGERRDAPGAGRHERAPHRAARPDRAPACRCAPGARGAAAAAGRGGERPVRSRARCGAGEHVGREHRRLVRRRWAQPHRHRRGRRRAAAKGSGWAPWARSGTAQAAARGRGSGGGRLGGAHAVPTPQVRMGKTQVSGRLPPEVIQRIVRQNFGRFRLCYEQGLRESPSLQGLVTVRFTIKPDGSQGSVALLSSEVGRPVGTCVARAFYGLSFPAPESGLVTVVYPISFSPDGSGAPRTVAVAPIDVAPGPIEVPPPPLPPPGQAVEPPPPPRSRAPAEPYTGRFKTVMDFVGAGGAKAAIDAAYTWHREAPGDVMALVALGEALEGARETATAARVYGSIVGSLPGARGPAPLRGRAAGAARGSGHGRGDRHLRQGGGGAPRSPREPPAGGVRAAAAGRLRGRVRGGVAGQAAAVSSGAVPRRGPHPPGGPRAHRGGVDQGGAFAAGGHPDEARRGGRHQGGGALAALRAELGDRRQRRRLPHPRRARRPRVLQAADARLRRRALRRRDHGIRARVLHHPAVARGEIGAVPARGPLLRARSDGLRDGQARRSSTTTARAGSRSPSARSW